MRGTAKASHPEAGAQSRAQTATGGRAFNVARLKTKYKTIGAKKGWMDTPSDDVQTARQHVNHKLVIIVYMFCESAWSLREARKTLNAH